MLLTTSSPKLPPELVDLVTDHSSEDLETLRALSLTARSCIPRTRYHLFHKKKVNGSQLSTLLPFLECPTTTMISGIRELTLQGIGWHTGNASSTVSAPSLIIVLMQLPHIRALYLFQIRITPAKVLAYKSTVKSFSPSRHLDVLTIGGMCAADHPDDILAVIATCRSIELLKITHLYFLRSVCPRPARIRLPSARTTIHAFVPLENRGADSGVLDDFVGGLATLADKDSFQEMTLSATRPQTYLNPVLRSPLVSSDMTCLTVRASSAEQTGKLLATTLFTGITADNCSSKLGPFFMRGTAIRNHGTCRDL